MPRENRLLYWDSCVFLSYVEENPERLPILEAILQSMSRGRTRVYTSSLAKVEVAFAASETGSQTLSSEIEELIDGLWSEPGITVVEFHDGIGNMARSLMRRAMAGGRSIRSYDATHLATAEWLTQRGLELEAVHTYDDRVLRAGALVGLTVEHPRTIEPLLIP